MTKKCPNCGRSVKGHPNKKFCNSSCKDRYHNRTNPRGYYAPKDEYDEGHYEGMNAMEEGWDGHKVWFRR